jgi:uncharacterized protein
VTYYVLDSSALVKAYLPEAGSAQVRTLLSMAASGRARAVVSALAYPEAVSAISRRERNSRITAADATLQISRIDADFAGSQPQFAVMEVTPALVARAAALVRPHALSGADAIHLSTALLLHISLAAGDVLEFVTSDARLDAAGRAEGLTVVVPA